MKSVSQEVVLLFCDTTQLMNDWTNNAKLRSFGVIMMGMTFRAIDITISVLITNIMIVFHEQTSAH